MEKKLYVITFIVSKNQGSNLIKKTINIELVMIKIHLFYITVYLKNRVKNIKEMGKKDESKKIR